MDNGRIKMKNCNGILCCDVYMNDEFSLNDLAAIREEIRRNYCACADLICISTGSYSVSLEVQKAAMEGIDEFRNIVYVADGKTKKDSAEFAAATFMKAYNPQVVGSLEEAQKVLSGTSC